MSETVSTTTMFVLIGLAMTATGVPLALRRIPPNRLYGLRVRATLTNPAVWYQANQRTGWDLIWMGAIVVVAAVALPLTGITDDTHTLLSTGILLTLTLRMAIGGWRYANRLLRLAESERSERDGKRAN